MTFADALNKFYTMRSDSYHDTTPPAFTVFLTLLCRSCGMHRREHLRQRKCLFNTGNFSKFRRASQRYDEFIRRCTVDAQKSKGPDDPFWLEEM